MKLLLAFVLIIEIDIKPYIVLLMYLFDRNPYLYNKKYNSVRRAHKSI